MTPKEWLDNIENLMSWQYVSYKHYKSNITDENRYLFSPKQAGVIRYMVRGTQDAALQ